MGTLRIKNLKFRARHGYHDFERVVGNDFEVDLCFTTDLGPAGESDRLDETLDYTLACEAVEDILHSEPVLLIESLLARIGDRLMDTFPDVTRLEVSVRKLHPPMETGCDYVEITDQWER